MAETSTIAAVDACCRGGVTLDSVTADLLRVAERSEAQDSASGLSVARAAYAEIARLNAVAAPSTTDGQPAFRVIAGEPLSEAQWTARFTPVDQP